MSHMIPLFESMWAHLVWADDSILNAVAAQEGASADEEIRKGLHHIVLVEAFFLSLFEQRAFDMARFKEAPGSLEDIERLFQEAHADGKAYVTRLNEAELARTIEFPIMKEFQPPLQDALVQVVMHSEHHRAQCAQRLRALGGKPPITDYIAWVRTVRQPESSASKG